MQNDLPVNDQSAASGRFVSHLTRSTFAIVLAGGRGSRLMQLTDWRSRPAVPFGGKFRIIDFTLSNCVNSGIRRIGVATQYKAQSLIHHLQRGWSFLDGRFDEFIELLPAQQQVGEDWYRGTADAVYQNLDVIRRHKPLYVMVLSGDHIYKMDYGRMLQQHQDAAADATVATILMDPAECGHFGVVEIDRDTRIVGFQEKPPQTDLRSPYDPTKISASMGIYIFNTDVLIPVLLKDAEDPKSSHDFGKDVLPKMLDDYRVFAFNFVDENKKEEALYWRDVGTLEAYYEANMDLVSVSPVFNLYDAHWPIRTHQRQYPPAKFVFAESPRVGHALDSLVSSGCIISGGSVQNCVLSPDVRVNSFTEVEETILFSHVNVGRRCRIRRAIIDRDVHIPEGTTIGYDAEADRERYFVTDSGITVVTRDYSLFENPVTVDYFTSE
jgi:glucose-1-phosphate adenylyltransferase